MTEKQQTPRRARRSSRRSHTADMLGLLRAAPSLVATLDPKTLYSQIVNGAVHTLSFIQGAILWIYADGRLRPLAIAGLPLDDTATQALMKCHLRSGEGPAGTALQRGTPQRNTTRLGYRELATPLSPACATAFQLLSEQLPRRIANATIPLLVGPEVTGVLELFSLGTPENDTWRPIEDADLPDLQIFASIAAATIKNAQLYDDVQHSERRLKAFDAVVTAIQTAADLQDLVHSALDVVLELVPGACGALLLLDTEHDLLRLGAQRDLPGDAIALLQSLPVADSPCAEVVHYGQPSLRPLLEERNEGLFLEAGLAATAYFPLLAGGTVAGVLALYGTPDLNRRADQAMLMPICNQVGFAIANVRLYDDSQAERRKLNTVVTSIAEGVLLCDSRGRLTLANEAALTLLGLNSLPFEQPLAEMPDFYRMREIDGSPLELNRLPFARALSGEIFQDYRLILRGVSGDETVMSFSGAPARTDNGTIEGAVVVFRDITASQRVERAKDEFLAVAAHELRSPLAAVRSYADLLLRREKQRNEADPRDLHGLTILSQQVSHMLRLVDNLLDVSRIDAGQLDLQIQPTELVSLISQVLDQQRPAAGSRELILESDDDALEVEGDPLRIRQVITNLVGNAIKYSPAESPVTVRLRRARSSELGDDEASAALISVIDSGAGVPVEQRAKLFQRYFRARGQRAEGLGLGLYLSRQFVQMHGGKIWVDSNDSAGSIFSFTLPLSQP
ncbi:MAG: GAF domain-containing protein [Oscillochloris sp.]|nr:GAF domain-containing protein [Oscillochloris sp.]